MKLLYLLTTCVLLSISVILGVLLYKENKTSNQYLSIYWEIVDKNINMQTNDDYRNFELYLNGKDLSKFVTISDGKGERIAFTSLTFSDKLVLYFSENSCDECVDAEVAKLNERLVSIDSSQVVILINASSNRYVRQYRMNHLLKYPVYEVKVHDEQILSMLTPFFFVLEKGNGRINAAFVPIRRLPEKTDKYLNKVVSDYLSLP